jgi:hypothetical protein
MAKKIAAKVKKSKKIEAYCVRCKEKQIMEKPHEVKMKNGRAAVKGECPECGTGMFKIGGM